MKKQVKKLYIYILILLIIPMILSGCFSQTSIGPQTTVKPQDLTVDTLILGYSEHFTTLNPFFADTTTNVDMDIVNLTQIFLLDVDDIMMGNTVSSNVATIQQLTEIHLPTLEPDLPSATADPLATINTSITPEQTMDTTPAPVSPEPTVETANPLLSRYDYEVTYKITLKDNLFTAEGKQITIDDLIFNMYVLCDVSYDGKYQLGTLPIKGIDEYRYGFNSDIYNKYATIAGNIVKVAPDTEDLTPYEHLFTKVQFDSFWKDDFQTSCTLYMEAIVDHINSTRTGIDEDSDLSGIALAMYKCDLAKVVGSGILEDVCGKQYDMEKDFPTSDDFLACVRQTHGYNIDGIEKMYEPINFSTILIKEFVVNQAKINQDITEENDKITGIKKTGNLTLELTLNTYSLYDELYFVFPIMPLSYYGETSLYNYENNNFGFTKGDIKQIRDFDKYPMGAGPFKYEKTSDGIIYLSENVNYIGDKTGNVKRVLLYLNNKDDLKYLDPVSGIIDGTYDVCMIFAYQNGYESLVETDSVDILAASNYKLAYSKERIMQDSMPTKLSDVTTWLRNIKKVKMQ